MNQRRLLIADYPHLLHGGDYNPDQWLDKPEIIDEDFFLMQLSGCNLYSVGIFAWTSYEGEEGHYDFDWLDRILERIAAAGHKVALATPSGAKPAWMSQRYPEIRRVNKQGRREPHGGRHNHCWSSLVYRAKVKTINTKLAERYAQHPALGMWHISNEYSGECYCSSCLETWRHWLQAKYESIDRLNQAWWCSFWSHTFSSFEEIDPRDGSIDGMQLDFRRFVSWQTLDFLKWEIAAIRQHSPDVPCTTNLMGTFSHWDYSKLSEVVDLIADDQYPGYAADLPELPRVANATSFKDDVHRCLLPDRPWMLMESCPDATQWRYPTRLKRPGLHQAEMLQALGHGAEGTCYFQWRKGRGGCEKLHGAVVDHVGHEHTRVFKAVAQLSQHYQKLTQVLGSQIESQVAILFDWEVRWAFEMSQGLCNQEGAYQRVCEDHYAALTALGVSVDVLSSERDFSKYKAVIAPQLWMLRPGIGERIAEYVKAGGCFVGTYYLGGVDQNNQCFLRGFPGEGLMEVFGIWNEETDWLGKESSRRVVATPEPSDLPLQGSYEAREVCAIAHLRGATGLLVYDSDFYAGTPALTQHRFGQGLAYYQAAWLGRGFLDDFYLGLVQSIGLLRAVPHRLPEGVRVQRRLKGYQEFLFVQNFTGLRHELGLCKPGYRDLLSDAVLGDTLTLGEWASTVLSG